MPAIVARESRPHRCLVVGDDLGTVPDELRRRLERADLLGYRLLLFERDGAAFRAPSTYPRCALVAWSTHDLPTLAGWWSGEDLRTRRALGLCDDEDFANQVTERAEGRRRVIETLAREGLARNLSADALFSEELALAIQAFLARAPSMVM